MQWINEFLEKSIVHEFRLPLFNDSTIKLFIKRDDLIHPQISGNKLRKLKFNLKAAIDLNCAGVVTFGGAFSNHLIATAAACNLANIEAIGYVRGDELNENSNTLLKECVRLGMKLIFLPRTEFSIMKRMSGENYFNGAKFWYVPEGGANYYGVQGCEEITRTSEFDLVCLAQGTTTTSIGVALSLKDDQKALLIPVLKGFDSFAEMGKIVSDDHLLVSLRKRIIIRDDFHFGGYAKATEELINFVKEFNRNNKFEIEPVYTGKAMFALNNYLISNQELMKNKKVLFVHTGGLHSF